MRVMARTHTHTHTRLLKITKNTLNIFKITKFLISIIINSKKVERERERLKK
jgi:hypothetical protein